MSSRELSAEPPTQPTAIPLELRHENGELARVEVRASDSYVNATALCHQLGKEWKFYWKTNSAKEFSNELSKLEKIAIQSTDGSPENDTNEFLIYTGSSRNQQTWVHPDIGRCDVLNQI